MSLLLECYGDEWLVIPAMHWRWNYQESMEQLLYEFGSTNMPHASKDDQYEMGKKASEYFRRSVAHLGATAKAGPALEKWTLEVFAILDKHFSTHRFLFGDQPSIGDFGLLVRLLFLKSNFSLFRH